ncbi:MAG: thioredoxin domain-containing protein [Verrucomicrobiota bacterium]|nr:thioredoxin domain-containing protein [Verrucomicrobiota bacterium]
MINVRNNGDVTDFIHGEPASASVDERWLQASAEYGGDACARQLNGKTTTLMYFGCQKCTLVVRNVLWLSEIFEPPQRRMKRYLPFVIIFCVLLGAVGGGALVLRARQQSPSPVVTKAKPASPDTISHTRGSTDAPVTLEEFGDFECQPCSIFWPILERVEQAYGTRLSVTFRQHPLEQHHYAREAARAAEAAGLQGHFWEMHDMLYRNRADWINSSDVRAKFASYATELKLDSDRFKNEMDGEEVNRRIAADEERGASLGIDRTPVVYINGQLMPFSSSPEDDLHRTIDAALATKGK